METYGSSVIQRASTLWHFYWYRGCPLTKVFSAQLWINTIDPWKRLNRVIKVNAGLTIIFLLWIALWRWLSIDFRDLLIKIELTFLPLLIQRDWLAMVWFGLWEELVHNTLSMSVWIENHQKEQQGKLGMATSFLIWWHIQLSRAIHCLCLPLSVACPLTYWGL